MTKKFWKKSKKATLENENIIGQEVKNFDWTYTTPYKGSFFKSSMGASEQNIQEIYVKQKYKRASNLT
jgi:hypothetical protein